MFACCMLHAEKVLFCRTSENSNSSYYLYTSLTFTKAAHTLEYFNSDHNLSIVLNLYLISFDILESSYYTHTI